MLTNEKIITQKKSFSQAVRRVAGERYKWCHSCCNMIVGSVFPSPSQPLIIFPLPFSPHDWCGQLSSWQRISAAIVALSVKFVAPWRRICPPRSRHSVCVKQMLAHTRLSLVEQEIFFYFHISFMLMLSSSDSFEFNCRRLMRCWRCVPALNYRFPDLGLSL